MKLDVILYDDSFNQNEFLILLAIAIGTVFVLRFRKMFPWKESFAIILFPIFLGMLLDHTISIPPFDFYDVNDASKFELFDFLSYVMFGPYGFLFICMLEKWKIKGAAAPLYILAWALVSLGFEYGAHRAGIYHYKNGYQIYFSFPLYLLILSSYLLFYRWVRHTGGMDKVNKETG